MLSDHPSLEDFAGFLHGTMHWAPHRRNTQVMHHLLADCTVCRERLRLMSWDSRRLARLLRPAAEAACGEEISSLAMNGCDYGPAFAAAERAVSAFLAPEDGKAEVPASLAELDGIPVEDRIRRVTAGGSFATPGFIQSLIDRSHAARYRDAEEMLHSAHLARLAAEACPPAAAGNGLRLADLRARAWGQYGNALRVAGRPREAEEALSTAQRHRKAGTGDPMLRAWLLFRTTPLAVFQGRFHDAVAMCDEAAEVYRELGENHLLASTLVQKAIATLYSSDAEGAIRILNQAIPLIEYEEDPHLLFAACHNLIRCYIDLGRPDQALLLYSEARELYQELDDPLILLRAAWQEGQLLRDLGHLRDAEAVLLNARKGYMERKLAYEAALVSLDLAAVYVKLGLANELKRTVLATVPIFHSLRVGLETLASLLQLQQVADQEQKALELIRALSARIEPLHRQQVEES
jgi:tetratricopeptide (TPR) repeat protein